MQLRTLLKISFVHFGLAGKRLKKRSRFYMIMHKTMEDPSIEPGTFLENTRKLGRSQRISGRLCAEDGRFGGVAEQKVGCFVLREGVRGMLRTKGGVFCSKGASDDVHCRHRPAGGQPLGMLLPAPTERNIRQSYTPDVVPVLHIKFNEH